MIFIGLLFSMNLQTAYAEEKIDAIVDWAQRVDLTIPVNGIVKNVSVNSGQIVKKGQVLVELDTRIFRANLRQAKAKVNGLKAHYDEIKRELDRAQELYDRTVLSDHDLQVAKNNEVIAKSSLVESKARYTQVMIDLEYASLVAPFDAIVLKRNAEVGLAIFNRDFYQKIITLASSSSYLAKAKMTSVQSSGISIGQAVKVVTSSKTYNAKIIAIEYGLDQHTGESTLVVQFTALDEKFHAGVKVQVIY